MQIRSVKNGENDCSFVYNLSNAPLVRANSFNSEPIIYENHVRWFNLHYGDGSFPLKDLLGFVPDDAMVTNEAKREKKSSLIEFLSDSKKLHTFTK